MHTIVSLYRDEAQLAAAARQLQAGGISAAQLHQVGRDGDVWGRLHGRQQLRHALKITLIGAAGGLLVGLLYGVTAGLLNCRLMGCPVTTALALLAMIAVYWSVGGAIVGGIIGFDRLEQTLYSYLRRVREGETLLLVDTDEQGADSVTRLLQQEAGSLVQRIA